MGSGASAHGHKTTDVGNIQKIFKKEVIPIELQVAHYTPSSFPMVPVVSKSFSGLMSSSWSQIVQQDEIDSSGNMTAGITAFYSDFYNRLDILDTSGRFEAVLNRNIGGMNRLQAKGEILIRIVNFLISVEEDNHSTQYKLYMLGKSHAQKGIGPWQYAIFAQTLLLTISSRLGTGATNDVMEAWVNVLAFVMKSMLPPAIENQVVETELNVNVSSVFATGEIQAELVAVEDILDMRHRHRSGSNPSSPHHNSSTSPKKFNDG